MGFFYLVLNKSCVAFLNTAGYPRERIKSPAAAVYYLPVVSVRSLPEGPEYATNLKRTTVETLAIRLRFRHPRLRFLQNGISERKAWNHLAILPESDESSKVALFARLPKVAPGEIIFFVEW